MHMVWHHNKRIENNIWKMAWDSGPTLLNDSAGLVQPHPTGHNVAEAALTRARADSDKIRASL